MSMHDNLRPKATDGVRTNCVIASAVAVSQELGSTLHSMVRRIEFFHPTGGEGYREPHEH